MLPFYAKPFPRAPLERDGRGRFRRVEHPFYGVAKGRTLTHQEYLAAIERGDTPARAIHGKMHAARTALWAGILAMLSEKYTGTAPPDLFILQVAAAFHDAARQDEGYDRWERESDRMLARWVRDRPCGALGGAERRIMRDADILDILRVCPEPAFEPQRLSFWSDPDFPKAVRSDIVAEAVRFIRLTEHAEQKRLLENSGALYFRLMQLIIAVDRDTGRLPLLSALLRSLAGQDVGGTAATLGA